MKVLIYVLVLLLSGLPAAGRAFPQQDGSHDFDFSFGTWHTHVERLANGRWLTTDGIVITRKLWSGKANLEELEIPMGSGYLEGMTLRMYDPDSQQWNLYFANSSSGEVDDPEVGQFTDGRGEFHSYDLIDGKATYVRNTYYDATATSYKFEQAFSWDAGKTWHPNFVASLNRVDPSAVHVPQPPHAEEPVEQHAFDSQFGSWTVHMNRLAHPLTPSAQWTGLDGTADVEKLWNGRANIVDIECTGPASRVEILALRLYLPQTHQWTLAFAGSRDGTLGAPMYGTPKDGSVEFYNQEDYNGRAVFHKFVFFDPTRTTAHDQEYFSEDAGKTWVTTFDNYRTRLTAASP
jgi:hypothetical protein